MDVDGSHAAQGVSASGTIPSSSVTGLMLPVYVKNRDR